VASASARGGRHWSPSARRLLVFRRDHSRQAARDAGLLRWSAPKHGKMQRKRRTRVRGIHDVASHSQPLVMGSVLNEPTNHVRIACGIFRLRLCDCISSDRNPLCCLLFEWFTNLLAQDFLIGRSAVASPSRRALSLPGVCIEDQQSRSRYVSAYSMAKILTVTDHDQAFAWLTASARRTGI
jgi:hypothetical protein